MGLLTRSDGWNIEKDRGIGIPQWVNSTDGERKGRGVCAFAISDRQGRPAISGECRMTEALVSAVSASAVYAERDASRELGYKTGLPMADITIDRAWYYDDYSFLSLDAFSGVAAGRSPLFHRARYRGLPSATGIRTPACSRRRRGPEPTR